MWFFMSFKSYNKYCFLSLNRLNLRNIRYPLKSSAILLILLGFKSQAATTFERDVLSSELESIESNQKYIPTNKKTLPSHQYTIKKGDTLAKLVQRSGVGNYNKEKFKKQLEQVMEADLNILALDVIEVGNKLNLWVDDKHQLNRIELILNPAKKIIYYRVSSTQFEYKEAYKDGIWRLNAIHGKVSRSFYVSARKAKLSPAEIIFIESLLEKQISFKKDVNRGDKFSILRREQYIDGFKTGSRQVVGVSYLNGKKEYTAFLHEDGDFYTASGDSLSKPFLKLPVRKKIRISSLFNPKRLHPITRRARPHNGIDLAAPVGTAIIAPGDGIVSRVSKHKYAGKYIVIQHSGSHVTRYLHLSKTFVTEGQRIKRGQLIALSGNSGRTTGPHLHYEVLVNDRAVNPLNVKIAFSTSLRGSELHNFLSRVDHKKSLIHSN